MVRQVKAYLKTYTIVLCNTSVRHVQLLSSESVTPFTSQYQYVLEKIMPRIKDGGYLKVRRHLD